MRSRPIFAAVVAHQMLHCKPIRPIPKVARGQACCGTLSWPDNGLVKGLKCSGNIPRGLADRTGKEESSFVARSARVMSRPLPDRACHVDMEWQGDGHNPALPEQH